MRFIKYRAWHKNIAHTMMTANEPGSGLGGVWREGGQERCPWAVLWPCLLGLGGPWRFFCSGSSKCRFGDGRSGGRWSGKKCKKNRTYSHCFLF